MESGEPIENRALAIKPRVRDENAGTAPREFYGEGPAETGYCKPYYWEDAIVKPQNHREYDWAKNHGLNHIGGTMRPNQAVPAMSPFCIEFEEDFGGYNFGGGNAQLDFKDMKFDWACGWASRLRPEIQAMVAVDAGAQATGFPPIL